MLLTFFSFNYNTLHARTLIFNETFDNLDNWEVKSGNWEILSNSEGSVLKCALVERYERALLIPKNLDGWDNYTAEIKLQSLNGVDQHFMTRFSPIKSGYSYYLVDLRADGWSDSNNIDVARAQVLNLTEESKVWRERLYPSDLGCDIENNEWYHIRVNFDNELFEVFLKCPGENDYHKIFSKLDTGTPLLKGGVAFGAWTGAWGKGLEKWYDNLKVYIEEEEEDNPLVLVPGLTASWNTKAMLEGGDVSPSDWELIPFAVPVYQRLIESLEANGYVQGENFFVWPYDWRQNLIDIETDLNNFILSTPQLASASKIDFIGHSLGGLAVRNWAQNYSDKAGRVVTVGSPHRGAVQAYEALAGGRIGEQRDWEWIGMQLLLHLNREGVESNAEVVREIAPVLNDLLPTFNYLQKNGRILGWQAVSFTNDYLDQLNQTALGSGFVQQMDYVIGYGKEVPRWLILNDRSLMDKILSKWPEGALDQVIFDTGDGTVLVDSAYLGDNYTSSFDYYHKELVEKEDSIREFLTLLGKDEPSVAPISQTLPNELLVYYLASPAYLRITDTDVDPHQIYDLQGEKLQMIYFPYPENKDRYKVEVVGVDNGTYHLHVGEILEDDTTWQTYEGEITEADVHEFVLEPDDPKGYFDRAIEIIKSIQNYPNQTWLVQAVGELENQDPNSASYSLARYSFDLDDGQISQWQKIRNAVEQIKLGWDLVGSNETFSLASAEEKQSLGYRLIRNGYQNSRVTMKTMIWQQADEWMGDSQANDPLISIAENFFQASYLDW